MDGACGKDRRGENCVRNLFGKIKGRDYLYDVSVYLLIILRWILEK
jgi:hypothetical protein